MSTLELLPCPFCGSAAKLRTEDTCYFVECDDPSYECCAPGPAGPSVDSAVELWNRRVSPSPPEKVEG